MKELLRGESAISLEAAVLKCLNAELYLYFYAVSVPQKREKCVEKLTIPVF
jgi:hypothetical protein